MKKIDNRVLKAADIAFILGVFFLVGAHFITSVAVWYLTSVSDVATTANNLATAIEANPIAVPFIVGFSGIATMLSYVIQPAIMFTLYYLIRKQYIKAAPVVVLGIAVFVFNAGMINVLNDMANLIGVLLQRGLL
jgi:hypothetical protein